MWYAIEDDNGAGQVQARDPEHAARVWFGVPRRESEVYRLWVGRWDRRRSRSQVQLQSIRVVLDPIEPGCIGRRHDWDDAPVRGVDGGIEYTERCVECGLTRRVSTAKIDETGQRYRCIQYGA